MTYVFKVEARNRFLALAGRLANDDKPTAVEPAASGKPATKPATKSATSTFKLMRFDDSDADDEHDLTPALQEAARQRVLRLAGMLDPPAAGDSGAGAGLDVDESGRVIDVEQIQADFLVAKIRDHGSDLGSDEAWDSEDERQKDLFAKANWAANKRFEISKFKFKFPRARTYEMIGLVLGCIEAKFCK